MTWYTDHDATHAATCTQLGLPNLRKHFTQKDIQPVLKQLVGRSTPRGFAHVSLQSSLRTLQHRLLARAHST